MWMFSTIMKNKSNTSIEHLLSICTVFIFVFISNRECWNLVHTHCTFVQTTPTANFTTHTHHTISYSSFRRPIRHNIYWNQMRRTKYLLLASKLSRISFAFARRTSISGTHTAWAPINKSLVIWCVGVYNDEKINFRIDLKEL